MSDKLPLILASGSLGRRELLKLAGYDFEVMPAGIEEPSGAGISDIRHFVHHVSWLKAQAVAPRIERGILIAADSVGWCNGEVIGKPEDEEDARRILQMLGGTTHELWTGVTLWRRPNDLQVCWQEFSKVEFQAMTAPEMDEYLEKRTWRGCSGAYAVQGHNDPFVRVVEGSVSNVVGLPMETLQRVLPLLQRFDADIIEIGRADAAER